MQMQGPRNYHPRHALLSCCSVWAPRPKGLWGSRVDLVFGRGGALPLCCLGALLGGRRGAFGSMLLGAMSGCVHFKLPFAARTRAFSGLIGPFCFGNTRRVFGSLPLHWGACASSGNVQERVLIRNAE